MTQTPITPVSGGILPMFTVDEVAALLHQSRWSVNKLARLGVLPGARRVGRAWLFQRNAIQRYVEGKVK